MTLREEQERVQAAMQASLSGLREDPWLAGRVLAEAKGERPMKKKATVSLALVIALIALTMSCAVAAGFLLSPRAEKTLLADKALEQTYGITGEMLTFFTKESFEDANGDTVVVYSAWGDLVYVLGDYRVTVRGNKLISTVWSHDGEDTSGGFDAEAWGPQQLSELIRLHRETGNDLAAAPDYAKARALAERYHVLRDAAPAPEDRLSESEFDAAQRALAEKASLTEEEMVSSAREAVRSVYGLSEAQMALLTYNPYLSSYTRDEAERILYEVCLTLVQRPSEDPNIESPYTEGDGDYRTLIDAESGVIETVEYDAAVLGNG